MMNALQFILEKADRPVSKNYNRARKIYEALSPEEQKSLGNFEDSDMLIFRYIESNVDGIDVGFVDVYKYNGSTNTGFLVIAVHPDFRGKGYSNKLRTAAIEGAHSKGVKKLIYRCDSSNKESINSIKADKRFHLITKGKSYVSYSMDLTTYTSDETAEDVPENENAVTEAKATEYTDKFGNKKIKGASYYSGMETHADEAEWRKKVQFIKIPGLEKFGYTKPQPTLIIDGKSYRARSEIIVVNDKQQVLLDRGKNRANFGYDLPGGGIDPKESIEVAARRECEEEARVIPKKIKFSGIIWFMLYEDGQYSDGAASFLCVAEYGKDYKGYIKKGDKDEFADRAKWEDYKKANLGEPHMIALDRYFNGGPEFNESAPAGNRRLKQIANTPEELNKFLNDCPYGAADFSGKVIPNGMENSDIEELYRTQSPILFEENGYCGNCWDYTIFVYQYFKAFFEKYSINAYYMQVDDGEYQPTHTWLAFSKQNDKSGSVYVFESAWKPYSGIKLFKSEKESIDYYKSLQLNYVRSNGANVRGSFILRFIPDKGCWGRNFTEFMAYVIQHSQWITGDGYLKKQYDVANKHLLSSEMEQLQGIQKMRTENAKISLETTGPEFNEMEGPVVGMKKDLVYVTQYSAKRSKSKMVEGYAVSNDLFSKNILVTDMETGTLMKVPTSYLDERSIMMFETHDPKRQLKKLQRKIGKPCSRNVIYETLTGKDLLTDDQLLYDENFKPIDPVEMGAEVMSEIQTMHFQYYRRIPEFELMNSYHIAEAERMINEIGDKNLVIMENQNGFFGKNTKTGKRTGYFDKIKDVPLRVIRTDKKHIANKVKER